MRITRLAFLCAAVLTAMAGQAHAGVMQLISNGSFETGDFTDWTLSDAGLGMSEVTNQNAPSNAVFPTVGPSQGSFYAVTSQPGPGTHAILQSINVAGPVASAILSFDMFVQTQVDEIVNPIGLDHTGGPNQHARVDILTGAAGAFDTGAGVLQNFYIGIDGTPPMQPYTSYSFDVTSLLSGGGAFQLRFAQTDNQGNFNLGVDNVSLVLDTGNNVVPEPTSIAIFGLGAVAMVGMGRRRKQKQSA